MDGLLTCKIQTQLSQWIGKDSQFIRLYKLSRDGGSAKKFHDLCDNKGPTVTIYYNTDNKVYGGYLSDSWRTFRSDYWTDNVAFLYKLYTTGNWKPLRFPHKEKLILKTVLTDHGFIHCLHFKHQLRWMKNHLPTFTVSARLIF